MTQNNLFKTVILSLTGLFIVFLLTTEAISEPTITLNGPMVQKFGIINNINHRWMTQYCGDRHVTYGGLDQCGEKVSYGAWIDGPINPYKYGQHTYFQLPASENYRIKVPNHDWDTPTSWAMEGDVYPSDRDTIQSHYNNRNWLFSVRNENNILYGLTHHEWYETTKILSGMDGFKGTDWWIASIGWAISTNGGTYWENTLENGPRMVTIPEPNGSANLNLTFGFMHPTNIVKETDLSGVDYYYFFAATKNYIDNDNDGSIDNTNFNSEEAKVGMALFRTKNLSIPRDYTPSIDDWQFWNGTGWTNINPYTFQGNFNDPQMPHVFWPTVGGGSMQNVYSVRRYNGKWITLGVLGSDYSDLSIFFDIDCREAIFSWTESLSNPIDLEKNIGVVEHAEGDCMPSGIYYSFFDPDSTDNNYESIGLNPIIMAVEGRDSLYWQTLTLSGF